MAPKNKKGDNFTWHQNEGTNAWTRDYSRPYKEPEAEKPKQTKKKATRKSAAPKTSSRPKKRDVAAMAKNALDRLDKDKPTRPKARPKAKPTMKGREYGMRGSENRGKITVTELSGIGADMPTQQKSSKSENAKSTKSKRRGGKSSKSVTQTVKDFGDYMDDVVRPKLRKKLGLKPLSERSKSKGSSRRKSTGGRKKK